MDVKETLHFKIGLCGSSKHKQPVFVISIDDVEYHRTSLTQDPAVVELFISVAVICLVGSKVVL